MKGYKVINIGYKANVPGMPFIEIGSTSSSVVLLDEHLKVTKRPKVGDLVVVRSIGRPQIKLVTEVVDLEEEEVEKISNGSRIVGTAKFWELLDGNDGED